MEGHVTTDSGPGSDSGHVTMVTTPAAPDLRVLSHRVKLLEHSLRDASTESSLQNRIRELEVSERSLLLKVDHLAAKPVLHCPSMLRQRLDERLHSLREEVRTMSQDKERGERVWRDRLQRCQAQLRAKEEEMGRQSQYFDLFKTQLQHKLSLARDREQALQSRVHQLEKQLLELTVSAATNMATVTAANVTCATANAIATAKLTAAGPQRTELERPVYLRGEGEGEEEREEEEKKKRRKNGQQCQRTFGPTREGEKKEEESVGKRDGQEEESRGGEQSHGEATLRGFILRLQEDLRVLLEREEQGAAERRGLTEQLQEAQENNHFLSCKVEEMKMVAHRLKLAESALTEEVEELQEENQRLRRSLDQGPRSPSTPSPSAPLDPSPSSPNIPSPRPSPGLSHGSAAPLLEPPARGHPPPCPVDSSEQAAAETNQEEDGAKPENSMLPLPKPDLLNLSGHLRPKHSLISLVTETSDVGEFSLGDWCPGGFPSPSLDQESSPETEALREAYRSMGGDLDTVREHRDQLETTLQHAQDQLQKVAEENSRLKLKLREQAEGGASQLDLRFSPGGARNTQENRMPTHSITSQDSIDLSATSVQEDALLALGQDDLALALNQENRALAGRLQELLSHMEVREGENEREVTQLRQQVSRLEGDRARLEQDHQEQGCLISELTSKAEDDLNAIMELQQRLVESVQAGLQGDPVVGSGCGQQGEPTVGLVDSLQGDHTVGSVCGLQGEYASGSVKSDGLTAESVCGLKEEREELVRSLSGLKEEEKQVALSIHGQTEEKHQLTRSVWVLKEERDQLTRSLRGLKEERNQLSRSLSGLKEERDKVMRSVSGLEEDKEQLTQSVSGLQEERDKLSLSLSNQEERGERDKLSSSLNSQKEERDKITQSMNGLLKERDQIDQSLHSLKEERDQLSRSMCGLQDERDQLADSLRSLKEQRDQAERSLCSLNQERDQLIRSVGGLEEEKDQTERSLCDLREERDQLTVSLTSLREQRDQLQADVDTPEIQSERPTQSQQPKESHVGMETSPGGVAAEMRRDVTQRSQATVSSSKTIRLGKSAQAQREGKEEVSGERREVTEEGSGRREEQSELMREIEAMGAELRKSREELEKTQSEAQRWYRELGLSEAEREEAERRAAQAANEVKRMREGAKEEEGTRKENLRLTAEMGEVCSRLAGLEREKSDAVSLRIEIEGQLTLLQTQLKAKSAALEELSSEYTALRSDQGSREEWSNTVGSLTTRCDDIRAKYDVLLKRKCQSDLDIAPLKAKLSCLVVKCQERNRLLVQMMRALRGVDCLDLTLSLEAEDLLNDSALQDYANTFTPAATASPESFKTFFPAASQIQDLSKSVCEGTRSEDFRVCVATADYCPSPNMPHTLLPTLPLSAGEPVHVTGIPDRRGLYHAEVKGEAGLVPACFLEENGKRVSQTPPSSDTCGGLSRKLTGPEKIINLQQQLQNTLSNCYQPPVRREVAVEVGTQARGRGTGPYPRRALSAPATGHLSLARPTRDQTLTVTAPTTPVLSRVQQAAITTPPTTTPMSPTSTNTAPSKTAIFPSPSCSKQSLPRPTPATATTSSTSLILTTPSTTTTTTAPSGAKHPPSRSTSTTTAVTPTLTSTLATPTRTARNRAASLSRAPTMAKHVSATSTPPITATGSNRFRPMTSDPAVATQTVNTPTTTASVSTDSTKTHPPKTTASKTGTPIHTAPNTTAPAASAASAPTMNTAAPTKMAPNTTAALIKMAHTTTAAATLRGRPGLVDGDRVTSKPPSTCQPLKAKPTSSRAKHEAPAEVGSVEVIRTVGQSSIMIGWERPPLDELGCSNGTFVYGYRVYVQGEFHKSVMSSACTKCILENLDLSGPVHISVQTLGSNGLYAQKVHSVYRGSHAPSGIDHASTNTSHASPDCRTPPTLRHSGSTQPILSRSLQLKTLSPGSEAKAVKCVAIYSYSPLRDSPNLHPSRELALREGDTVTLLGNPRKDGFCKAEVNGRRGLAPVAFLEEVPVPGIHPSPAPPSCPS